MTVPSHPRSRYDTGKSQRRWRFSLVFLCISLFIFVLREPEPTLNTDMLLVLNAASNSNAVVNESYKAKSRDDATHASDLPVNRGLQIPSSNYSSYYCMRGRWWKPWKNKQDYEEKMVFKEIGTSKIQLADKDSTDWVLPRRLAYPTRNHGSVLFETPSSSSLSSPVLWLILGRHSRYLQAIDLKTGAQQAVLVRGLDPDGSLLGDLNHVYTVVVDSLDDASTKEVWLPCGFHGDKVNQEESSTYARIVRLTPPRLGSSDGNWTATVEVGPKLAIAGGACVAAALEIVKGEPPHICTFGGTQGNHDTGNFLPYASCYDRVRKHWHHPFGRLPMGFDHGSLAFLPPQTCHSNDPGKILIFNYRTENYGTQRPEILAYDWPTGAWKAEDLRPTSEAVIRELPKGPWYVWANISYEGPLDEVQAPRDASGMVLSQGGRQIINFGGTHYQYYDVPVEGTSQTRRARNHVKFATIRGLDVCTDASQRKWSMLGNMGVETFAIQSSASATMNVAISCGGHSFSKKNENNPWCFVTRLHGMSFDNDPNHMWHNDELQKTS